MTTQQATLAKVPLFARLQPKSLEELSKVAIERRFDAGAEIVTEGEGGVAFFLILDGTAELVRGDEVVSTLEAGASFGEMALLDGQRRSATIRAATPVTCVVLTRWDFLSLVRSDAELAVELLEEMSRRVRALEAQIQRMKDEG